MPTTLITRSWLAFAAVGAGIIHLALVIGSPPLVGALLLGLGLGLAEIAWGVLILVKDRMVVPRIAQAGAIAPLMLWALLVVTATLLNAPALASSVRFLPMGIAAVLSVHFRRESDPDRSATSRKPTSTVRYLSAGILVGALTTPALAAAQAGTVALEHGGTMSGMMDMPGMSRR